MSGIDKLSWEKMSGGVTIAEEIIMPTINQRAFVTRKRRDTVFFANNIASKIGLWKIIMLPAKKEII